MAGSRGLRRAVKAMPWLSTTNSDGPFRGAGRDHGPGSRECSGPVAESGASYQRGAGRRSPGRATRGADRTQAIVPEENLGFECSGRESNQFRGPWSRSFRGAANPPSIGPRVMVRVSSPCGPTPRRLTSRSPCSPLRGALTVFDRPTTAALSHLLVEAERRGARNQVAVGRRRVGALRRGPARFSESDRNACPLSFSSGFAHLGIAERQPTRGQPELTVPSLSCRGLPGEVSERASACSGLASVAELEGLPGVACRSGHLEAGGRLVLDLTVAALERRPRGAASEAAPTEKPSRLPPGRRVWLVG